MFDLETLWSEAKAGSIVCSATGSTKNMVLNAITEGARDFDAVAARTPLCRDNECAKKNVSGRGCRENVNAILSYYLPIFDMMTEGGGCRGLKEPTAKRARADV